MLAELSIILALVLLNGVFAAAEISVVSLRGSRLEALIASGSSRARAVQRLRRDPERFLATVQIGITVVGAVASAFGGASVAEDLVPLIEPLPWLGPHAETVSLGLVVAFVSYLSLVLGELIPKSLALRFGEGYALWVASPLLGLSRLARPLVWFLTASSNAVLRLFGDRTTFTESRLSPEEIQQLVDEAAESGAVDPNAGEIASRALDFAGLTAAQIMVPRNRVVSLPRSAPGDEVQRVVLEKGHTRMPVHEGTSDNVVGYVNVKDIFAASWKRGRVVLQDILRPAYFVAETMRAVDLLNELRRRRTQLAIVVDENGDMSGIVTLEDLLEELVGDISNEHDAAAPEMIHAEADGSFLIDGQAPVRDVNRELDLDLPEGEGWSTVAGLSLELAGRIPAAGEVLRAPDGTTLEITDATPRQVRRVRLRRRPAEEASTAGGEALAAPDEQAP
ncbi:hemolysin family protein [Sorangium sp. So ce1024]|uniref:hemolysin family protein n=1 Tax=Sorangium sp. So ce1024 TaxID=3133327 RepID=UPI003F0A4967